MSGVENEISNSKLSRLLSVEVIGSALMSAFLIGVTWNSLAADVKTANDKIGSVEKKQVVDNIAVQSIRLDVREMKVNQKHLKEDFVEQQDQIKEQGRDIKEILKILSAPNGR